MSDLLLQFLIVSIFYSFVQTTPTYTCEHESNGFCYFYNLNVTQKEPHFIPTSDRRPVTKVDLGGWYQFGSMVKILTSDICDTFPEIEVFYANSVSLTKINTDALNKCTKLVELSISQNNLTDFPYEILSEKGNLRILWAYSNNFVDLDPQKIMQQLANLTTIYLNDNDISCSKMKKIISTFKARNVSVLSAQDTKIRNYDKESVVGVSCVPDSINGNSKANIYRTTQFILYLPLIIYYLHEKRL